MISVMKHGERDYFSFIFIIFYINCGDKIMNLCFPTNMMIICQLALVRVPCLKNWILPGSILQDASLYNTPINLLNIHCVFCVVNC
jgi:hypothetical protein